MWKNYNRKGKGNNSNNKRSNQNYRNQSEILEYNQMDRKPPSTSCDGFRSKMVNQPHGCKALREPRKPVAEQGDNFDYYHSGRNEPVPPCPTFSSACKIQPAVKPPPYVPHLNVEASGVPLKPKDGLKPFNIVQYRKVKKNTSNNEDPDLHIPFSGFVGIDQAIGHSLPAVATCSAGTGSPSVTDTGNGNGNGNKKKDPPQKPRLTSSETTSDPRSFSASITATASSKSPMSTPVVKTSPSLKLTSEPPTNVVHEPKNLVVADADAVEFEFPKLPTPSPPPAVDQRDEFVSNDEVSSLQNQHIGEKEKDEASGSEIRDIPTAMDECVIDWDSNKNEICHSYSPSGIEDQYTEIDVSVSTWTVPNPSIETAVPIPTIETVPIPSTGTCRGRGRGRGRGIRRKFNPNLLSTEISSPSLSTEIESGDGSNFADVANEHVQSYTRTGHENSMTLFLESNPVTGKQMVRIFNVKSPQSFMIQTRDAGQKKDLLKLESAMVKYWDSDDYKANHHESKAAELKLFGYYALFKKESRQCFRVRLMKFREVGVEKLAVVTKIDHGEEETVSISNLMPLKDSWKDVPQMCCYAKCCKLTALAIASVDDTKFQSKFDDRLRTIELDSIENVSLDFEGQNYTEKFASVKLVTALLL